MAKLLWRPARKFPETHYFVPEKGKAPGGLGRRTPDCPGETFWIDGDRRPAILVHRYKPGASLLAALRAATRQAAHSMQKRGTSSALFVYPPEAAAIAPALLAHVALSDYDFRRYRSGEKRPRLTLGVDVEGAEVSAADRRAAEVAAEMAEWARDLG